MEYKKFTAGFFDAEVNFCVYNLPNEKIEDCDISKLEEDIIRNKNYLIKDGDIKVSELRLEMQKTMQNHAGVFRNDILLSSGVEKMKKIYEDFPPYSYCYSFYV